MRVTSMEDMERATQDGKRWPREQQFTGINVTSGGSVFQGSIRTKTGAININLAGNVRDQRRLDVLAWLSTIKYIRHHKFARSKRLQGTGEWLLRRNEYQRWTLAAGSCIFWLYGIPGAGKTELASLVIDTVAEDLQSTTETALLYFYCGSDESDRRSSACLMRTLIHQLLCISPSLFQMVDHIYEMDRTSGFSQGVLDYTDSIKLLAEMVPIFKRTFIVIDALDECDANDRSDLLDAFEKLSSFPNSIVKIFVTSRYTDDIALALDGHLKLLIKTHHISNDISIFIDYEINSAVKRKKLLRGKADAGLQQTVKSALNQGANGMFLWAQLQIDHLCDATGKADLLLALRELPVGLTETYDRIWTKIQQQRPSRKALAEQALELLLYSLQPLSADAVAEAVTPDGIMDQQGEEVIDYALILDVCQSLVVLDSELGVLRPIHLTAQTFLKDRFPECVSHSRIAASCLRRISNIDTMREISHKSFKITATIANFALYAILNWPDHVSRGDNKGETEFLERTLLADETLHYWWIYNLRVHKDHRRSNISLLLDILEHYRKYPDSSSISACFFGLRSAELAIVGKILPMYLQVNYRGGTDLHWAPRKYRYFGSFGLGGMTLRLDDWRIAGLMCASEQGHASIVQKILGCIPKDDTIWSRDKAGYLGPIQIHALWCCTQLAIANGHVKVIKAFCELSADLVFGLMERYNPYHKFKDQAPFWANLQREEGGSLALAAFRGQRSIIGLLLSSLESKHIDQVVPDRVLEYELGVTASWQNEKAFATLLNFADHHIDLTLALIIAASTNNERVINLILETSPASARSVSIPTLDVNRSYVNVVTGNNRTALITAAWRDHGAAAMALCRDSRVDLHRCDGNGLHAQRLATKVPSFYLDQLQKTAGATFVNEVELREDAYEHLLNFLVPIREGRTDSLGTVDPRRCDSSGMNALQISVLECHTDFLESILERDDLDVNVRGRWGETPLIVAVRKGHTAVVKLLLNSGKADTSLRDEGGLTAMDIAVLKDHEPIINLLSHRSSSSENLPSRENKDEATESPSVAMPIGRWFQ